MPLRALLCFLVLLGLSSAPAAEVRRFAPAQLREDIAILRRTLEELHPGLQRYLTPEQFDAAVAELEAACDRELGPAEAFLAISEFTAKIRCGHTFPNPANQGKTISAEILGGERVVPFHFQWIGSRMVVTRGVAGVPAGTVVRSINGRRAEAIKARLMRIARADGSNDAKRETLIAVDGTERLSAFDIYLPLMFPWDGNDLALETDAGPVRIAAVSADARASAEAKPPGDPAAAAGWSIAYPQAGTAVLRMDNWALYNSDWDWAGYLDAAFAEFAAKRIGRLVIDIRRNEGGLGIGNEIIRHLSGAYPPKTERRRLVRYRQVPADLLPHLDTWDDSFKTLGADAEPVEDGFFLLSDPPEPTPRAGAPGAPFKGTVAVLVGPTNSSATFEFARTMRELKLGKLVGRPTGGNQRGINGGAFFFLRLPNTRIEVDIPLIGQFAPKGASRPDSGLDPDIFVEPDPKKIAAGLDADMEAALQAAGSP